MKNIEKKLDPYYEKATEFFGSTIAQAIAILACSFYNFTHGWVFINVISEIAINLTLLLLRGQWVGSVRMEKNIDRAKKDTKADLEMSKELLDKLKS